jgi:hypothetical protein
MKKDRKDVALERTRKINALIKTTLCAIGLCVAMVALAALYDNVMPNIIGAIENNGEAKETVWAVERLAYLPPSIITVLTLYFVYCNKKSYVPVTTQRQKALVVAIVMAFVYGIMFSGIVVGRMLALNFEAFAEGLEDFVDMYDTLVPWLLIQVIPFSIILAYHLVRASSEQKELEQE